MYSYVLLLLLACITIALSLDCVAVDGEHADCACAMDDGSGTVDISSYARTDNKPRFTGSSDDFTYDYNPCFPMNVDGYSNCADSTAAGCQLAGATGYNIGKFDHTEFSVDSDSNVVITYNGGDDKRFMTVTLKCNHDLAEPKFVANGEVVQLHYDFTLESKCSCAYKEGESCTKNSGGRGEDSKKKSDNDPGVIGIVLLCVALMAFVSYFVIGAVILKVKYQKSGTDLIINKNFWKDFPLLVKDGVVFTFSPCYKMIKDRRGYSNFK